MHIDMCLDIFTCMFRLVLVCKITIMFTRMPCYCCLCCLTFVYWYLCWNCCLCLCICYEQYPYVLMSFHCFSGFVKKRISIDSFDFQCVVTYAASTLKECRVLSENLVTGMLPCKNAVLRNTHPFSLNRWIMACTWVLHCCANSMLTIRSTLQCSYIPRASKGPQFKNVP